MTPFPIISVLGMDVLSHLINRAVQGNFLAGYKFEGRGDDEELISSILLYADDMLVFL